MITLNDFHAFKWPHRQDLWNFYDLSISLIILDHKICTICQTMDVTRHPSSRSLIISHMLPLSGMSKTPPLFNVTIIYINYWSKIWGVEIAFILNDPNYHYVGLIEEFRTSHPWEACGGHNRGPCTLSAAPMNGRPTSGPHGGDVY